MVTPRKRRRRVRWRWGQTHTRDAVEKIMRPPTYVHVHWTTCRVAIAVAVGTGGVRGVRGVREVRCRWEEEEQHGQTNTLEMPCGHISGNKWVAADRSRLPFPSAGGQQ